MGYGYIYGARGVAGFIKLRKCDHAADFGPFFGGRAPLRIDAQSKSIPF